jgi:hypothetical protein
VFHELQKYISMIVKKGKKSLRNFFCIVHIFHCGTLIFETLKASSKVSKVKKEKLIIDRNWQKKPKHLLPCFTCMKMIKD